MPRIQKSAVLCKENRNVTVSVQQKIEELEGDGLCLVLSIIHLQK